MIINYVALAIFLLGCLPTLFDRGMSAFECSQLRALYGLCITRNV